MEDFGVGLDLLTKIYDVVMKSWSNLKSGQLDFVNLLATFVPGYIALDKFIKHKSYKYFIDPKAVWSEAPYAKQLNRHERQLRNSIPVIAVANDKGGVGKSTIVANLAAYYDQQGANVLVVDFDDQGSLERLLPIENSERLSFTAQHILNNKSGAISSLFSNSKPEKIGKSFNRTFLHASNGKFGEIEKKLQFDWLTKNIKKDIRYNLHEYLSKKKIQEKYDIVLIDTGSGMSLSVANALCAASHVLIPTEIDNVSSSRTIDSITSYQKFRNTLDLGFSILGVMPTMILTKVDENGMLKTREAESFKELSDELGMFFKGAVSPITQQREKIKLLDNYIYRRVAFSLKDDDDAAYFKNDGVKEMFVSLGRYIDQNLGKQGKIMRAKVVGRHNIKKAIFISEQVVGQKIEQLAA